MFFTILKRRMAEQERKTKTQRDEDLPLLTPQMPAQPWLTRPEPAAQNFIPVSPPGWQGPST